METHRKTKRDIDIEMNREIIWEINREINRETNRDIYILENRETDMETNRRINKGVNGEKEGNKREQIYRGNIIGPYIGK